MGPKETLYKAVFCFYNNSTYQRWWKNIVKNTMSDQLNYLMVLAEEQNITRAADRLFISQPALTVYLNRLERDLGVRLFDRSTNPIRITEAGTYYISELEKICSMQDRLARDLLQFNSDPDLKLNLGIGRNRGTIWLPMTLPRLQRMFPDAEISVSEDRDANMIEKVLHGVLDMAVVETYVYNAKLSYLRLPQEFHLFLVPRSIPLMKSYDLTGNSMTHPLDVDAERLSNELFICPSVKGSMNRHTQWMCTAYNFHPKRTMFISNAVTVYQMVANGMGIAFENAAYSHFVHTEEKPVFVMPGGSPTSFRIYVVFNAKRITPLHRTFMQLLHDAIGETLYGRKFEMEYM